MKRNGSRRWVLLTAGVGLSLAMVLGGVAVGARADDQAKGEQPKPTPKTADRFAVVQNEDDDLNPFGLAPEDMQDLQLLMRLMQQLGKQMEQGNGANGMPDFGFLFPNNGQNPFAMPFGQQQAPNDGRLGIGIAAPPAVLVEQLELPEGRGMVVTEVKIGSAAAKAGLKTNDLILEFDGQNVPSETAKFVEMVNGAEADVPLSVVVLRKGRKETIEGVTLPKSGKRLAQPNNNPFGDLKGFPGLPLPPNMQRKPFAFPEVFPGQPAPGAKAIPNAGADNSMSVQIRNGKFTADMKKDDLSIRMTGTTKGGTKVDEIVIKDGDAEITATDIKDVPEKYREDVEAMLKQFTVVD